MQTTTISVRINKKDKERFDQFCKASGLNFSTAINMFIKATILENKIPFEIKGSMLADTKSLDDDLISDTFDEMIELK